MYFVKQKKYIKSKVETEHNYIITHLKERE